VTVDSLVRTIGAIVAPVVMITSCSIFLNGLFARYESISARMRSLHRERLDLMDAVGRPPDGGPAATERREHRRIREVERQLPGLLLRHRLLRDAVMAVVAAMLALVTAMLLIGAAEVAHSVLVTILALLLFVAGTAAFLAGVATAARELWRSEREIAYEIEDGLRMR
jgi:hypothetical protein